jgi:N-acetylneuraminic acid mutarotase
MKKDYDIRLGLAKGSYKAGTYAFILFFVLFASGIAFPQNTQLPNMPYPRVGMCSARLGSKIYLIGGASSKTQNLQGLQALQGIEGTKTVEAFDLETKTWDDNIAPLGTPRSYATAVALGDSIYVMGGVDDSGNVLNSVEVYDPSKNEWHYAASMLRCRKGAASVVYGDSILVFGGSGQDRLVRLVEIYSPAMGTWTPDADTTHTLGRVFHHAVKIGPRVYIFGGLDAFGPVGYVEKYLPGEGVDQISFVWRYPRAYFDVVENGDSVYVISGLGNISDLSPDGMYAGIEMLDFHVMDEETEAETSISSAVSVYRAGFVACVYRGVIYLFGGISPLYYSGMKPISSVAQIPLSSITAVQEQGSSVPSNYSLSQNYPNPFNPTTIINYQISATSLVTVKVYDILGREVATLVDQRQNPGSYSVVFDGSKLSSGVYFYRLSAGRFYATKKMILAK